MHRYHPPLVYGRRGNAETGEGISLAVGKSKKGEKTYLLITYILPIISARAVPQQINFYNDFSTTLVIQSASWSSSTDVIDHSIHAENGSEVAVDVEIAARVH